VFCYGVVLKANATKVRIKRIYDVLEFWKITHSLFYLVSTTNDPGVYQTGIVLCHAGATYEYHSDVY